MFLMVFEHSCIEILVKKNPIDMINCNCMLLSDNIIIHFFYFKFCIIYFKIQDNSNQMVSPESDLSGGIMYDFFSHDKTITFSPPFTCMRAEVATKLCQISSFCFPSQKLYAI